MFGERAIEEEGREVHRRLYAHHDYFGNIIPSSWFAIGSAIGAYVFYRQELANGLASILQFMQTLGEPSTGIDVLIAIILAIITFNVIYIIGQLLNGVAAVILDRVIVKKLLQYPFTLYERKWQNRDKREDDSVILREAVLSASYAVFCVNLIPVIFFEFALVAFGRQNPHAGSWVQRHPLPSFELSLLLVIVHLGLPSIRKATQLAVGAKDPSTARLELLAGHYALIMIASVTIAFAIVLAGLTPVILLLPFANVAMALTDRKMLIAYGPNYKSPNMRRVFLYARRTFVNPAYFAAKIVGYGTAPAAELIGKALAEAKYDSRANDFYWMCQLKLENEAPRSYDTAYHGMAMYTMNRNLCNATALVAVVSVVAFYLHWPEGHNYATLTWVATLCALTYIFFVRYLYLFSGLYSKYVVRAAAFLADREKKAVIVP